MRGSGRVVHGCVALLEEVCAGAKLVSWHDRDVTMPVAPTARPCGALAQWPPRFPPGRRLLHQAAGIPRMDFLPSLLATLAAYLVGSLSFAVIVSRAMGLHPYPAEQRAVAELIAELL